MKFSVNQQDLQKSLGYCQGVIEKRSTLPILSNILIEAANSKLIQFIIFKYFNPPNRII